MAATQVAIIPERVGILSVLREQLELSSPLSTLAAAYRTAKPYPHLILDDFLDPKLLDAVVAEMPSLNRENWVHEQDETLIKYNLRSAVDLGPAGYRLVSFLHSAGFLYLLSELTGIADLLPDPYLQGSGYHIMPKGGFFQIHADRNTAYSTGLTRRLAFITYLNKSWRHEYGGQLELWNLDGSRQEVVIEPHFNRTVIFEITDQNFHGVPKTIACPDGRSRNSFALYYHTVGAEGVREFTPHSSIYAPSFYQKKRSTFSKLFRDWIPPVLGRAIHKLRHSSADKNGNYRS